MPDSHTTKNVLTHRKLISNTFIRAFVIDDIKPQILNIIQTDEIRF